jgi:hypothetical protein
VTVTQRQTTKIPQVTVPARGCATTPQASQLIVQVRALDQAVLDGRWLPGGGWPSDHAGPTLASQGRSTLLPTA